MKRSLVLINLVVILLLSGCMGLNIDYVPNSVIADSLMSRMQNNAETNSLEGFTRNSTFSDVMDKIETQNISQVHLIYNSELLGYPVVSNYDFNNNGGSFLSLDMMFFSVLPDGEMDSEAQIEDLIAKMDAELGSHQSIPDDIDDEYSWDQNSCSIGLTVYDQGMYSSGSGYSDVIAVISVYPDFTLNGMSPQCPELFPYSIGTSILTVYQNETPSVLPEGFDYSASLDYEEDGIDIKLWFLTDEEGNIRLNEGRYDIHLNDMNFKNSLNYFEAMADGLSAAVGEPEARGYGIPDVFHSGDGYTYDNETPGAQGLSAQDIADSGQKAYWLDIRWRNIQFRAEYVSDASITVDFPVEYIEGTIAG